MLTAISRTDPSIYPLDLSVVIPTFNQVRYTQQCIESIAQASGDLRYEIIVVDNVSTDETLSYIGSHTAGQLRGKAQGKSPKRVTLLHNTTPRHLAKSWNMGLLAAVGRIVIISNNDVIYSPGSLQELIRAADENPQAGVVLPLGPLDINHGNPKLTRFTGDPAKDIDAMLSNLAEVADWHAMRFRRDPDRYRYVPEPFVRQGGYCFVVCRRAMESVGLFDEQYTFTGEDYEYFWRVRRTMKMVQARWAYVAHYEHLTAKASLGMDYHELLCRNRFRLTEDCEGIMELFSIIMPTYNRTKSLKVAIDSVLAQSFPHWRLYVVDDGSSNWDEVADLSREYREQRNRIWFFHLPKNQGPAEARNFPLASRHLAKGKYIAFLDSDDIWYQDHLTRHFNEHERGDLAMLYSDPDFAYRWWEPRLGTFQHQMAKHPTISYFGDYDQKKLVTGNYIQTSAVTIWGDLARSLSFPAGQHICEDWEYFKAVADAGGVGRPVRHLAMKTCRYHQATVPWEHEQDNILKTVLPNLGERKRLVPVTLVEPNWNKARIGVVIPTQNRHDAVRMAIGSVGDVPLVVVDDAGESPGTIAKACRDRHAGLLRFDQPRGASEARNRGAECAPWQWIKWLDDDDLLVPGWLDIITPHLTDDADALVFGAFVPAANGFRVDHEVFTSQICCRASAFVKAGGFDEGCQWAEERDLLGRMAETGARIVTIQDPICIRPQRGGTGDPTTAKRGAPVRPQRPPSGVLLHKPAKW